MSAVIVLAKKKKQETLSTFPAVRKRSADIVNELLHNNFNLHQIISEKFAYDLDISDPNQQVSLMTMSAPRWNPWSL